MNNYGATESEGRRRLKNGITLMKTRLVLVPKSHLGTRTNVVTRLKAHQENRAIIFSSSVG